jgi:hypothetical protein
VIPCPLGQLQIGHGTVQPARGRDDAGPAIRGEGGRGVLGHRRRARSLAPAAGDAGADPQHFEIPTEEGLRLDWSLGGDAAAVGPLPGGFIPPFLSRSCRAACPRDPARRPSSARRPSPQCPEPRHRGTSATQAGDDGATRPLLAMAGRLPPASRQERPTRPPSPGRRPWASTVLSSRSGESNPGPPPYHGGALPTELLRRLAR